MKILLTQPRLPTLYQKPKEPPLNLALLASVLENHGFIVKCIDMEAKAKKEFIHLLQHFKPDILGLSSTTMGINRVIEMAAHAKAILPDLVTIAGGYGVSCDPEYVMNFKEFDYALPGETEISFPSLCNNIRDNKDVYSLPGIIYRDKQKIIINEHCHLISDLSSLPVPNFSHFNFRDYGKSLPLFTTRGCPYNCLFCVVNKVGGKGSRAKNAISVVNEIEHYVNRYKIKIFNIIDDNFSVDKIRVHQICDEIIKRKLEIQFLLGQGIRADHTDRELFFKMKEAGCTLVSMGVETTNPDTGRALRRGINLEKISQAIRNAKSAGLIVKTFNLIGGPFETYHDVINTIKFNENLNVDIPAYALYQPFPGSDFLKWVKSDTHVRINPSYSPYTWSNPGGKIRPEHIPFETDYFTFKERHRAYIKGLHAINRRLVKGFLDRHTGKFARIFYPLALNRISGMIARKLYLKFLRGKIEPWD